MSPSAIHARLALRRPDGFALDLDLSLPDRGVTVLHGASGSGKTTCLRLIAGLERASRRDGFLSVGGEVWQDDARGLFVPVHRRALGYVFQEANLFAHLSVAQNLDYGRRRRPGRSAAVDRDAMIALLGIGHLLARRPATLSGGERQRVAIARALLAAPRILLLDEPLAALDPPRKREILPYLERLRDAFGIPMIYVSHSPEELARLADHVVLLDTGRVVACGPVGAVSARLDLPSSLLDDLGVVIEGVAASHDAAYRLLAVEFCGGELRVVHDVLPRGAKLRLQIKARDVSLALRAPTDTSIVNLVPAVVAALGPAEEPGHVLVGLHAGETRFSARITRQSAERLGLRTGLAVCAQIKAVAVLA